jgi:pimeloyl-ACP methyl ester carboxylesterase
MSSLQREGAQLEYRIDGDGSPTLAFVHGWCSRAGHWDPFADRFVGDHRVVRWDRRGMGASSTSEPAATARVHADDLAALLDAEGVERVVLVAHAGGGPTALSFATAYPDRTDALVLVDARLHSPGDTAYEERSAALVEALSAPDSDEFMAATYRTFFGDAAPEDVVEEACANAVATPRDVAVAELAHVATDTKGAARAVACPVLWVSARPDDGAMVSELFADVAVGHVVGSGHFVQVEVPDQLEAMLRTFLLRNFGA